MIQRFIPAGAGNTPSPSSASDVVVVYPRWRGEHTCICRYHIFVIGLSPLARGTLGR